MVEEAIPGLDINVLPLRNLDTRFLKAQNSSCAAIASTNSNSVGASSNSDVERLPPFRLMILAVETNYRTREQPQEPAIEPVHTRRHRHQVSIRGPEHHR